MRDGDVVDAGIQVGHPVDAGFVGLGDLCFAGINVFGGDFRVWHRCAGAVGDRAADRSGLGPQASWKSEDCEQTDDHGPEFHAVSPPLGV